MVFNVKVKWGKEKFELELDADEDPDTFRAQLFGLTGVSPDRQKIMFKGKVITDSWSGVKLKSGMSFLLMGSAKEVVAPTEKVVFEEDLSAAEHLPYSNFEASF